MRRNFDYLQMGSIDYKRSLMLKQQKEAFQKMRALRALEQMTNRFRMQQIVAKTKAFCRWREVVKELSLSQSSKETNPNTTQLVVQELLTQFN